MKKKSTIIQFSIALLFFLISVGVFFFLHNYINKKNSIAVASADEWKAEETKRANVKAMEQFLEERAQDRQEIDTHFVPSTDVVGFLDHIESFGPKVGAVGEVTLIDAAKDGSGISVEIRAKGNFESVYKFLALLENAPYEIEITTMNMRMLEGGEGARVWEATFKIKLLSFIK